jgi:hypothetical protein
MGTSPPPELEEFLVEREFFRELGWTRGVPLGDQPHKRVEDYSLFISMIRREEQARSKARR